MWYRTVSAYMSFLRADRYRVGGGGDEIVYFPELGIIGAYSRFCKWSIVSNSINSVFSAYIIC